MARKIKKKDLKKPDRFQTFFGKSIRYVSENRNKFLISSGIFILIILSLSGWHLYRLNYEDSAQRMYLSASGSNNNDKIEIYKEVVKKYPRSNAALMSLYNMGNIYFNLNDIDKSINAYREFIEKSHGDNVLITLAYVGLGYCYEAGGDFDKALELLNNPIKHGVGGLWEGIIYRNMARIYEEMNKPKEALGCYKKALNQTADPVMEALIKRKIWALN
jgi:tetratricopeptide (TPR) repeat protein